MIRIDDREARQHPEFGRLLARLGARSYVRRLPFGDFSWRGYHGDDTFVRVGVERKRVDEILDVLRGNTRFEGHQLPGMFRTYDPRHVWLIVEGYVGIDARTGLLTQGRGTPAGYGRGTFTYFTWGAKLHSLEIKLGVRVLPTVNGIETAYALRTLYGWYQKPWSAHKTGHAVGANRTDGFTLDESLTESRSLLRRIAAQLPGVGWERSRRVEQHFGSIVDMVSASEAQWRDALGIKSRRSKLAAGVRSACFQMQEE